MLQYGKCCFQMLISFLKIVIPNNPDPQDKNTCTSATQQTSLHEELINLVACVLFKTH